jgi:hypothetical protein
MTSDVDAREHREEASGKIDVFDWWDFLLILMPIAMIVLTMWWDASW